MNDFLDGIVGTLKGVVFLIGPTQIGTTQALASCPILTIIPWYGSSACGSVKTLGLKHHGAAAV